MTNLKLNIIGYNTSIYVFINIIGSFVAACVPLNACLSDDERIRAASYLFPPSCRLRLGVFLLFVITVVELHVRTSRWPHWSLRLIFIGMSSHDGGMVARMSVQFNWPGALRCGWRWYSTVRRDRPL